MTKWIVFDGWDDWLIEDINEDEIDDWIEENTVHELGKELLIRVEDAKDLICGECEKEVKKNDQI